MKHLVRTTFFVLALSGGWLGLGATASAQAPAGSGRSRTTNVIELDTVVITGQVQRPNAFYILNRQSLGYEVLDLRTSFTREIIRSVGAEPF